MLYFIVYDTNDDPIRNELRETLYDLGGDRVQYSAFIIELTHEQLLKLMEKVQNIIIGSQTDVRIIPMCKKDTEKMQVFSNYTSDEENHHDQQPEVL